MCEQPQVTAAPAAAKGIDWKALAAWAEEHRLYSKIIAFNLLAMAVYLLLYYIGGPSIAYLHSDTVDSLLWAQATVETGQVLAEDFHYAALLPFGGNVWMVPVLQLFGYGLTAHTVSMSIFAILFVLAAFSLFRAMKWSGIASAGSALLLSLLLSGSVKLREIMWEHVIYYSLGILLLMVLLNLCLRLADYGRRFLDGARGRGFLLRFGLLGLAFLLLCIGCGTDGFQMLVLTVLPVLGGYFVMLVLDDTMSLRPRSLLVKAAPIAVMGVGLLAGLKLLSVFTGDGAISAGYETAYSNWASMGDWWKHIEGFLNSWLTLFGVEVNGGDPLFSLESVFLLLKLVVALLLLVCPVLLLTRYAKLQREGSRLVAWAHCVLLAVILLGYICGALSAANWRLTPLLGSSIIATLTYFRELLDNKDMGRRMAVLLTVALVVVAGFNAYTVLELPQGPGNNQKYITITEALAQKGYTKGYASFWNAGVASLLSDGEVMVVNIDVDENGVRKARYQNRDAWFEDEAGQEFYFLMLTQDEYMKVVASHYWLQLHTNHHLVDQWQQEGFYILVFSGNPIF